MRLPCDCLWLGGCALVLLCGTASASGYLPSQLGTPGALQTPDARMAPEGSLSFGFSRALPYSVLHLSAQPVSWLNVNARSTDIAGLPYGFGVTSQSFKDKSFDISLRLLDGDSIWPALSIGLVDLGGTGLFSSEYVVATQQIYDLRASIGLGWGRLGSYGDFDNPLASLSDSFRNRPNIGVARLSDTGRVTGSSWFRGQQVAAFGSLIWQPAFWPAWSFVAELEGNDYTREPLALKPVSAPSRVNFGVSYAFNSSLYAGLSYLRGDTLAFQLGVVPRLGTDEERGGKAYLPELISHRHPAYQRSPAGTQAGQLARLYDALRAQGVFVFAIDLDRDGSVVTIWQGNALAETDPVQMLRLVGRSVLDELPGSVQTLRVVAMQAGLEVTRAEIDLWVIERDASGLVSDEEFIYLCQFGPGQPWQIDAARYPDLLKFPTYNWGVAPALRSNILGIRQEYLGQLLLKPYVTVQFTRNFSVTSTLAVNLISNLDRGLPFIGGTLPRVRSDLVKYQSESGDVYLQELEANYFFPIAPQWYGRFSGGIFEDMYGGVAAEVMYRPFAKRWALSLDANYVRQRDFDQGFRFRDYDVATGHLTLYYNSPWKGIGLTASVGRYLAKDVGATVSAYRRFRNGTEFGIFATKTDASPEEIGEGSFDKGFFLYIPLEVFTGRRGRGAGVNIDYRFLTLDAGQKVEDGRNLYDVLSDYHAGRIHER